MTRFRGWISLFAIFGVLMHAALIVNHGASMLRMQMEYQALSAAYSTICHGGGIAAAPAGAELPALPQPPGGDMTKCPICLGAAPTVAIMAVPLVMDLCPPDRASERVEMVSEIIARKLSGTKPPSHAPPAIV